MNTRLFDSPLATQLDAFRLRRTKRRREDVLPLPVVTADAIAGYLKFERPQATNRAVFVRHIAARDQPIGPDCVR